jgi:hypothetical protein
MGLREMDGKNHSSDSGYNLEAGSLKHDNEPLYSVKVRAKLSEILSASEAALSHRICYSGSCSKFMKAS